jgi:hypothetical protein
MSRTVTLRRAWRPCPDPDPIDGITPLTFYSDTSELDVEAVHVFPHEDSIAVSFITGMGSINVTLPLQLARELGAGLVRLADDATGGCGSPRTIR